MLNCRIHPRYGQERATLVPNVGEVQLVTSSSGLTGARFDRYSVDLSSGALLRSGVRIPLQEQPFQVLRLLLDADGKVVTREQLREALWPGDTFVDFDHSVNTAIKKLRQALGDTPTTPIYSDATQNRIPFHRSGGMGDGNRWHEGAAHCVVPIFRPESEARASGRSTAYC